MRFMSLIVLLLLGSPLWAAWPVPRRLARQSWPVPPKLAIEAACERIDEQLEGWVERERAYTDQLKSQVAELQRRKAPRPKSEPQPKPKPKPQRAVTVTRPQPLRRVRSVPRVRSMPLRTSQSFSSGWYRSVCAGST